MISFRSGLRLPKIQRPRVLKTPASVRRPPWIRNEVYFPIIDDQGQTGMCAAYSFIAGVQAFRWREFDIVENLDERPLYDAASRHAGQVDPQRQMGLSLEDVLAVANDVLPVRIKETVEMTDPDDLPWFVQHFGWVYAGLQITRGWMDARPDGSIPEGRNPMTGVNYDESVGGHALPIPSYDFKRDQVIYPNSWGTKAGCGGLFVSTREQFRRQFVYGYGVKFEV